MQPSSTLLTALALLAGLAGNALAADGRWVVNKKGVVDDTFAEVQWTQRDNLGDIDWNDAKSYCENRAVDGGGWQLPTMNELSQIYSGAGSDKVPCGAYDGDDFSCRASKLFYLTGPIFLSSEQGNSSADVWFFDFENGGRFSDSAADPAMSRALCVRRGS